MNDNIPWWSSETFWKKTAIWVTGFMFVVLVVLTLDTLPKISVGSERVPAYSVINKHIDYVFNDERNIQVPVIGENAPLFGKMLTEEEAEALVTH
ncbi:MAG: cytochrome c, partial [Ghiorsea sp.]|nr:cytochrome c [Ghiorsea sp.]